jgi:hypothetical protein
MNDIGSGDRLARGAIKATWGVNNVSQEKWDAIFGEGSGPKLNNTSNEKVVPVPKRRKTK